MPKRTDSYRESLLRDLLDPEEAAGYLNAAIADGEDEAALLLALRDIAEAHQFSRIASEAGMARESIYRTLSAEGNPRHGTLRRILNALGLTIRFEPIAARPQYLNPVNANALGRGALPAHYQQVGCSSTTTAARKRPARALSNLTDIGINRGMGLKQNAL